MKKDKLSNRIELMRMRLYDTLIKSDYCVTPGVLYLSTRLDELMNEYDRIVLAEAGSKKTEDANGA